MKKLGIIGGAGPMASALFYETLVQESYRQNGQMPEIFLFNYPFVRGLTLGEGDENSPQLRQELEAAIKQLGQNRVDRGVIICNTLHRYLPKINFTTIPLFLLPEIVLKQAHRNGHQHLLILGTQNTCQQGLYKHPSIKPVYPYLEEQLLVDRIIDQVLEGKIYEEDAFLLSQMIQSIAKRVPIDGVVLGCTDLPVLHHHYPIDCHPFVYDSIKLPAKYIYSALRGQS